MQIFEATEDFFKKEMEKESLFIKEKYLDCLPEDWFDKIFFIVNKGIDQIEGHVIVMDEKQTERCLSYIKKENIQLWVLPNDNKGTVWNCYLTPLKIEESDDPVKCLVGGKNLRKFCDQRNIYYKTFIGKIDGEVYISNLKYLKYDGEDCSKPINL